ncbi:Serine/threonine protein kinase [Handroanthus impetiginosus]|uniref:Serine/threonine protein kinase n=1 Tax=Handroanthus impetiginosus TaxID=429701 RepID=A0A2G9HXK6_9LAMI|nr:Serine/threonine protein kinase [Handroanthus impetiginosus]
MSFVQISEECLLNDPRKRPTMAHVVSQLEFVLDQCERTILMPTEITVAGDETMQSTLSSEDEQNVSALLREKSSCKLVRNVGVSSGGTPLGVSSGGTPHKRKNTSDNKPLWLWPWEALWNKAKLLRKKDISLPGAPNCHLFTISDILASTKNFDDSLIITSDDFCTVYKGLIKSFPTEVAVVRVKRALEDKFDNTRAEIEMLSQVSHPNLASVIGFCYHSKEMIIVYDYAGNSILCDYLYNTKTVLSWKHRLQICIGAAQGLKHLHNESIIHRDVRPANIFLSMDEVAKLLSFGFHSLGPLANLQGAATTTEYLPQGTQYLAPEFFSFGKLTEKSDVYSFGLVLLEMVSGTRTFNNKNDQCDHYLPDHVKRSIERKTLHQIIDPRLRGEIAAACLSEFLKVALRCLIDQPTSRPSMDNIVEGLESALEAQVTAEAESLKNIESPNLRDSAFELRNVYVVIIA